MEDKELFDEITWVMQNFGSDAGDRAIPGSKLRQQAERIVEFVMQREIAGQLLAEHKLDLVKVVSITVR